MQTLYILIGIPACGKSTYANSLKNENTIVLSSDQIRKELFGSEKSQINNSLVFSTLYSRAKAFLNDKKDVIIDSTAINRFERQRILSNFTKQDIKKVAIVFSTPINACIERDRLRNRCVGEDIISMYANKFEPPNKKEGFDEIILIKN